MSYYLPYVVLILFFLAIAIFQAGMPIEEKTRKYINFLVVICYLLFFGFRGLIGWDWVSYYPFITKFKLDYDELFEPGFIFFSYLFSFISKDYGFFILLNTVINLVLLLIFFKRYISSKYFAFGLSIFIALSGFVLEVDLIRNFKSILLFMISLKYIEDRKLILFLLLNVIGMTFHWTSVVYLPLYFIFHKPIPLKIFLIAFIVGNIIILFKISYIKPIFIYVSKLIGGLAETKTDAYLSSDMFLIPYGISFGYFARSFLTILVLFYYERIIGFSKWAYLFINLFFVYIVIYLYFSEVNLVITRLSNLFSFSLAIIIPILLEVIKPVSTRFALFALYAFLVVTRIYTSTNNIFYKYDNSLMGKTESYESRLETYRKFNKQLEK